MKIKKYSKINYKHLKLDILKYYNIIKIKFNNLINKFTILIPTNIIPL